MLWQYQKDIAQQAAEILRRLGIVYLAMEVRVGKTLIALEAARLLGKRRVFFVTKKKAISSIQNDYKFCGYEKSFQLDVVNYEQVHKYSPGGYDMVVIDEAHLLGAFPKPSLRTRRLKEFVGEKDLILLSGTPTPESFSQIYHQFWISKRSPFLEPTFYKWAHNYVDIGEKFVNGMRLRDYSNARIDAIQPVIAPYMLAYSQKQAGFSVTTMDLEEQVIEVKMRDVVYEAVNRLLKRGVVVLKGGPTIVADTKSKMLTKVHQLFSGTVIGDNGERVILDDTKAKYIRENIGRNQLVIFYKYQAEFEVLCRYFPNFTTDPFIFSQASNRLVFLSQVQAGAMGIDLSAATALVFYNIDFSFVNYWQAKNRVLHRYREQTPRVFFVFAKGGIEHKILHIVRKKRDYTTYYFKRDFLQQGLYEQARI